MRSMMITLLAFAAAIFCCKSSFLRGRTAKGMPFYDFSSTLPLELNLQKHVTYLAETIGERSPATPESLQRAADFIRSEFEAAGYHPADHVYVAGKTQFRNIVVKREGVGAAVVVGAHYDTIPGSPGADDNASGVAVLIELARLAKRWPAGRPIHFVAFSNEEGRAVKDMGSAAYADHLLREGQRVHSMVGLEMLGYYDSRPGSQKYPALIRLLYPATGDFVALVANMPSRRLLKDIRQPLKRLGSIAFSAAVLPSFVGGIDRSDHSNFWERGIPAVMVTDTAFYRNPHYHRASDTPDTLNYRKMADLTQALADSLSAHSAVTLR